MNSKTKIDIFRQLIFHRISPLIGGRVALFGLPCHGNIGDTYIATGELSFLKQIGAKIIYKKMLIDSTPLPNLPSDCTILLQGGGDFGDVWRGIQECRLKVLDKYKDHKIVIFPQSVFYNETSLVRKDSALLAKCTNLTICARDNYSFEFLKNNFKNEILLVPDMAFFIPVCSLKKHCVRSADQALYLKRIDKEQNMAEQCELLVESNIPLIISDWPTVKNDLWCLRLNLYMVGFTDALLLRKMFMMASLMRKLTVWQMIHVAYPIVSKQGVAFLSSFKTLYLTRLHSAILSLLIGKEFVLLDNSYHKNQNFYETWLKDCDLAEFREGNKKA